MDFLIFACAIFALIFACVGWRLICRRVSLPWPYWLAWWLENPYMKVFCHPDVIARRVRVKPGMKVLEIGCGAGRITIPIAKLCRDRVYILGMDLQKGMLAIFSRRLAKLGLKSINLQQEDFTRSHLQEREFDRAVMVTVLGEMPDHPKVLNKIREHLKPGGILSITEVIPDPCYLSQSYIKKHGEQAGFVWIESFEGPLSYTINLMKPA